MHISFATMGLLVCFGYIIGLSELAGAVSLWLSHTVRYASTGLFIIMLGATYFHIVFETFSEAIPAIISAMITIIIFVVRRDQSNAKAY